MNRAEGSDEFIAEIGQPFSDEVAKRSIKMQDEITKLLSKQRGYFEKMIKESTALPDLLVDKYVGEKEDSEKRIDFEDFGFEFDTEQEKEAFLLWFKANFYTDEMDKLMQEEWTEILMRWITDIVTVVGEINLAVIGIDTDFGWIDDALVEQVEYMATTSTKEIIGTNYRSVMKNILGTVKKGNWSIPEAVNNLKEEFAFSNKRAKVIARTEILRAQSTGQFGSDIDAYDRGLIIGKEWHSTHDHRTRDSHVSADGQVREFLEPFELVNNGTVSYMFYPRDTSLSAPANEVIQCRCFYTRIMAGQEQKMIDAGYSVDEKETN